MKLFFARYVLLQVLYSQTRSLTNVIQSLNLLLIKYIFYSIYVNFIHLNSIFSQEKSMDFYDLLLTCNPIFTFTWIEIKYQELNLFN